MSVPQDTSKNNPLSGNKEQKVIVLSMKNMPSFKFDVTKGLLSGNQDNGQSVFSFKPQQLLQAPTTSHAIQVQATQSKANVPNIQVVPQTSTILIRAQSPTTAPKQPSIPQQISLMNHPNIKIQESTAVRKIPTEITMKNQAGHTVLLHSTQGKKLIVPATSTGTNQTKFYQIPCQPKKVLPKQPVKIIQTTVKETKPIPILPKPADQQKIVVQQHVILPSSAVLVQQSQQMKPNVITIPVSSSSLIKYNVPQQQQPKWTVPAVSIPPPALAPIQPKVQNDNLKMLVESLNEDDAETSGSDDYTLENEDLKMIMDLKEPIPEEKTPQKIIKSNIEDEQQFLNVKRIIEGDGDVQIAEKSKNIEEVQSSHMEMSSHTAEINENISKATNTTTNIYNNNSNSNNTMLLCEEQLASITPEESPEDESNKMKEDQVTPVHTNDDKIQLKNQSIEDVKKTLKLDLISTTAAYESEKPLEMDENESIVSDDQSNQSSMVENKNESPSKRDVLSVDQATTSKMELNKGRRSRKAKNPTVNTSLGLPYKPPQPSSRKKKVEKKIELEMDFHDPLNKILWEDGIGGLNNCNKLFGFNEFGLIEVLTKRDATAKLKLYEETPSNEDSCSFKFRKIVDPQDQYVCVICSKLGTVRDFFSPECCSEACLAITKRKTTEFHTTKDESIDSGLNTPTDAKKVVFEGEMVTLQQLQQHLLEQTLPASKKKQQNVQKKIPISVPEVKFSWESYLTPKSVPAPENLFLYTSKTATTHFRVGMKLEAIDPKNQDMICVCTVEEKLGCRMKLHFDGYPASYDFWTNSDSFNIFNVGFCQSTGRKLHVPPRWCNKKFDWTEYFDHTNSAGAQRYMFPRLVKSCDEPNPLAVGMKLEVMYENDWYAATITDVLNSRILVRFDGDYQSLGYQWYDIHSPYLNPCNGHKLLNDPNSFKPPFTTKPFDWTEYLRSTEATEAPKDFFVNNKRKPYQFEPGMKLEIVDKVNPQLIRPATILCQDEYKIQVIFDGFDLKYAYWLDDDSEDIHPINYCKQTEHPIEHPAGANKFVENSLCSMNGCRGLGNGLHLDRYFHDNNNECPYNYDNWTRLIEQKENSRLDYKPHVRKTKTPANNIPTTEIVNSQPRPNRSLLIQSKYKKEKQEVREVKQEPQEVASDDKSSDAASTAKRRGKKRKNPEPIIEDEELPKVEEVDEHRNVKMRVVQHFLDDYGPQINYAFNLWTKNSKVLDRASITDDDLTENPMKWNVDEVCTFLIKFCDEETTAKFVAQKIDGEALLSLCQNDLVTLMNIKIGPSIKIYNRILWLRQEVMTKFADF